jgi:hypothetical protein
MVDLTRNPYEVRIFQPVLRAAGMVIGTIGVLASAFDSYWKPMAYEYLSGNAIGKIVASFVPYMPIALIVVGISLTFRAMRKPLKPSKEQIDAGRF